MIEGTDKTHTWIVDPLDGTTNFLHAIPHFAINIALQREGADRRGGDLQPGHQRAVLGREGQGRLAIWPCSCWLDYVCLQTLALYDLLFEFSFDGDVAD